MPSHGCAQQTRGKHGLIAENLPEAPFSISSIRAILSLVIVIVCSRFSFATEP
jgi:hypothetical protein